MTQRANRPTLFHPDEGTIVLECVAPLAISPTPILLGYLPVGDAEITIHFLATGQVHVDLGHRRHGRRHVDTCPVRFEQAGNPENILFKLAISWDRSSVTVAAGGAILADSRTAAKTDAVVIPLKSDAQIDFTFEASEGTVFGFDTLPQLPDSIVEIATNVHRARRCLVTLAQPGDLAAVVDSWKTYLDAFVKVRNKLIAAADLLFDTPQERKSWSGVFQARINASPLLSYLLHARNADNHALKAIVREADAEMTLWSSGVTHIQSIIATPAGIEIQFTGTPPNLQIAPQRILAIPVTDAGQTYAPPNEAALFLMAQGGLVFLEGWLREALLYSVRLASVPR
jgi:hypothetical protein